MTQSLPDAPAPSEEYGLGRLFSDSLSAPFRPGAVFGAAAAAPPPSFAAMAANILAFTVAMFALNILRVALTMPAALNQPAWLFATVGLLGLALALAMSFVTAFGLHVLARLAGGGGPYRRSYQILATLAALGPINALLQWLPWGWAAGLALAAYGACAGFERLHAAPPVRARTVLAVWAALFGLGAWAGTIALERALLPYRLALETARGAGDIAEHLRQIQAVPGAPQPPSFEEAAARTRPPAEEPPEAGLPAGRRAPSGLDLLAAPSGSAEPGRPDPRQVEAIGQAAAGMVQSVMPMLADPALTQNMSPEQRRQFEQLTTMLGDLQKQLASGRLDPQKQAAMMAQFQQLTMQLMLQAQQAQSQAPAKKAASRPREGGR